MRMLNDRGVEDLSIGNGTYDDENINEPPLIFNQMKRFQWRNHIA